MTDNIRIKFVNRETGEEGKASENYYTLAVDDEGNVWEFGGDIPGEESSWDRPDLRAEFVPDWIGVEERLPEEFEPVWLRVAIYSANSPTEYSAVEGHLEFEDDEHTVPHWFSPMMNLDKRDRECQPLYEALHWMPLPSTEVK